MNSIEKSILSMALQYPETSLVRLIGDGVTNQHFSEPRHKLIFSLMKELDINKLSNRHVHPYRKDRI